MLRCGFPEAAVDVGGFEHGQGGAVQAVAAVVVDEVQDLDAGAVGEVQWVVSVPQLVGLWRLNRR